MSEKELYKLKIIENAKKIKGYIYEIRIWESKNLGSQEISNLDIKSLSKYEEIAIVFDEMLNDFPFLFKFIDFDEVLDCEEGFSVRVFLKLV